MKPINACALGAAAFAGLLGWGTGASAAFDISLSPTAVEGTPSASFVFHLDIDDFTDLGIDVSDAPRLAAIISIDPIGGAATPAPFSLDYASPGTYFDTLFNAVGLSYVDDDLFFMEVSYSAFDPGTFQTVPLPASGRFVTFGLSPTPAAAPGSWTLSATLFVDNESDPVVLSNTVTSTITLVPEPETYALFAAGLLAVAVGARRRRH